MHKRIIAGVALVLAAALSSAACVCAEPVPASLKEKLGLSSVPRGESITINLTPQPRCFFGDLDVMYLDTRRFPERGRILLTLEPLAGGGKSPAVAVHEFYTRKGSSYTAELQLRRDLPAGVYGVFICSDLSGEATSCGHANYIPFADLLAPYRVAVSADGARALSDGRDEGPINQDRIYFFRPLVITEQAVFYSTKPGQERFDEDFAAFVKKISGPAAAASAELARIGYADATLSSVPFTLEGGAFTAFLPYYNPVKCGAAPAETEEKSD